MRLKTRSYVIAGVLSQLVTAPIQVNAQAAKDTAMSLATGLSRELSAALARPAFATQLNRARTELPALASTTQLLIASTRYMGGLGPLGTTPRDPPSRG